VFPVLIAGLSLAPIVQAQIYKWTDDQGNVHFGDKPENPESASEAEAVDLELNYVPQERTPDKLKSGVIQESGWALLTLGAMARDVTANEGRDNPA
jgi:hypothetical protein